MENLAINQQFWKGKRIFITGHTGFKGGWLCLLLKSLGASVYGLALSPVTDSSLYEACRISGLIDGSIIGDIRDIHLLKTKIKDINPDIVFHLAAQPLVRNSFIDPVGTYSTNVIGTVNLLESVRYANSVQAVVNVTTDKCYDNKEWVYPYRENDALGGFDPYSNSKACAELVTLSYRRSFFEKTNINVATARAGNVIGGGDWSKDRLIPDIIRSVNSRNKLRIRYPNAVRPWQHVLEPLLGYLSLAENMASPSGNEFADAWNFGPSTTQVCSVKEILTMIQQTDFGQNISWEIEAGNLHEANMLSLDSSKSNLRLRWLPKLSIFQTLEKTFNWYSAYYNGSDMLEYSNQEIQEYLNF